MVRKLSNMARMTHATDVVTSVVFDPIVSTDEAARILGVTTASVCRYTQSGYLPTVHRSAGTGHGGNRYERAVVEDLARRRAEARRVLNVQSAAWRESAQ